MARKIKKCGQISPYAEACGIFKLHINSIKGLFGSETLRQSGGNKRKTNDINGFLKSFILNSGTVSMPHQIKAAYKSMVKELGYTGDKFKIKAVNTSGGFADVYRIKDKNGVEYALKCVYTHNSNKNFGIDPEIVCGYSRDEHENTKLLSKRSRYIMPVIQTYCYTINEVRSEKVFFMLMPWLTPLTEITMKTEYTEKMVANIAAALCVCEEQGIYHRDIKLNNIYARFDEDGEPYFILGDFGIGLRVKKDAAGRDHTNISGNIHAAPEMKNDTIIESDDFSCDRYSVAHIYLTYTNPEVVPNLPQEYLRSRLWGEPNEQLVAVALKAISENADDRHRTANEFYTEVCEAIDGYATVNTPPVAEPTAPEENSDYEEDRLKQQLLNALNNSDLDMARKYANDGFKKGYTACTRLHIYFDHMAKTRNNDFSYNPMWNKLNEDKPAGAFNLFLKTFLLEDSTLTNDDVKKTIIRQLREALEFTDASSYKETTISAAYISRCLLKLAQNGAKYFEENSFPDIKVNGKSYSLKAIKELGNSLLRNAAGDGSAMAKRLVARLDGATTEISADASSVDTAIMLLNA